MSIFNTIKKNVSIVTVVSDYVTLKRIGGYWKGCCPFHHERTASFTVTPDKEIFYCFGCHAGGDVIAFVSRAENCSQLEAAQQLAERHGIDISQEFSRERTLQVIDEKKRYHHMCLLISTWCHEQLSKNQTALSYVRGRNITVESIKNFTLGYFPSSQQAIKLLLPLLQKEGFIAQDLLNARIALDGRSGIYFPFEDRILFPIKDHLGRVCGFGGRVFKAEDTRAKYYNSHEHAYFNKGTLVFGLDVAKKSIQAQGSVFLVEGYTDCIMMAQAGFTSVIATLGTACTADHLKMLSRYAQQLYIVYDGDAAGKRAIMRLGGLCWQYNIDPLIISLPSSDDPASYLAQDGSNFAALVTDAQDLFSFYVGQMEHDFTHKSLKVRVSAVRELLEVIIHVQDALKRDMLLQQLGALSSVPLVTLQRELAALQKGGVSKITTAQRLDDGHSDEYVAITARAAMSEGLEISLFEKQIFSAILNTNNVLSPEDEEYLLFSLSDQLKPLFIQFQKMKRDDSQVTFSTFFNSLSESAQQLISHILIDHSDYSDPKAFAKLFNQFLKKQWKMMVNDVKIKLADAQKKGDAESIVKMVAEFQSLRQKMVQKGLL